MIVYIGQDYILKEANLKVHVQDTDFINHCAKVGVPDANGIVWDTYWIDWSKLDV